MQILKGNYFREKLFSSSNHQTNSYRPSVRCSSTNRVGCRRRNQEGNYIGFTLLYAHTRRS